MKTFEQFIDEASTYENDNSDYHAIRKIHAATGSYGIQGRDITLYSNGRAVARNQRTNKYHSINSKGEVGTHSTHVDALNAIKEGVEELEEATKSWTKYGEAVKGLVDKYKAHDAENTSYNAGGNFRASSSGKIEYEPTYQHRGGHYGFDRVVHHAVKIGSNYPKDKAAEFEKEHEKITQKHLPDTINWRAKDGSISTHKIKPFDTYGSNYSVKGVFTHE